MHCAKICAVAENRSECACLSCSGVHFKHVGAKPGCVVVCAFIEYLLNIKYVRYKTC